MTGAAINVNVDGGGTAAAPVLVARNQLSAFAADVPFLCGKVCPGSLFNIAPGAYVDRDNDNTPPNSAFVWNTCP